jgi:hypothetical protein
VGDELDKKRMGKVLYWEFVEGLVWASRIFRQDTVIHFKAYGIVQKLGVVAV